MFSAGCANRIGLSCLLALSTCPTPGRAQGQTNTGLATAFGLSRQVNVDAQGNNTPGDAANEPSLCVDPTNPQRMAVAWRQFDHVASDFREAGWAYTTNGGLSWTFGGVLETNVFRSDPVLAADAEGRFYYLSLATNPDFHCDLWRSTDGGLTWQGLGAAYGGDKPWMTIDTTTGPARGNIYQSWSHFEPASNNIFTRSVDEGLTWATPQPAPQVPYWGTLDVGPAGELYLVGMGDTGLWLDRCTNAWERSVPVAFDLATPINLGGTLQYSVPAINPVGLLGQLWVAADRSTGPTRGNVYVLASVSSATSGTDVMFIASTNGGVTWSPARRINDDPPNRNVWHWFGTMSVAPNGRIDACWNDTRHSSDASSSELYYSWSVDGGLAWAPNQPLSPPFQHRLGYPGQEKIGDYIGIVSLNEGACIAYTATFNGEQDIFFVRAELPLVASVTQGSNSVVVSWNSVPGVSYCVQYKGSLEEPWSSGDVVGCVTATGAVTSVEDKTIGLGQRFYRVIRTL